MTSSSPPIAVFGDVMLDLYWTGSTHRISPESPVPVVNIKHIEERLGGAANVALNIKTLRQAVTLIGSVGDDDNGKKVASLCHQQEIETCLDQSTLSPTITKLRIISRQQHIVRCDFEDQAPTTLSSKQPLKNQYKKIIDDASIVLLSDYQKGFLADPQALIAYAQQQNKPIIIDPKGSDFLKYKNSTLLTPNLSEFEAVMGVCQSDRDLFSKAEILREQLNLQALLITRSEKGMTLFEKDKEPQTFSAQSHDVFDVTGAGDTVIALIATYLAQGCSLAEACKIANIGASIVVGKMGASQVTPEELNYALGQSTRAHHRVLTQEELLIEVKKAKQKQEIVVMTNGCFDLIHRGHVVYLDKARKLGDRLIVALNSDASVRRLKGADRPIMDEISRATVLASLASVDWVVLFDEDSPEALIEAILPDILVKGSDYHGQEIKGAQTVIEHGGKVELIDFIDGYSTTKTVDKIKSLTKK